MPQITTKALSFAVLGVLALALSGCGDANQQATFDSTSGKHPANWLPAGHSVAAEENINGCTECHGDDLTGGIAKFSCFEPDRVGCHIGGTTSAHPVLWGQLAYALHAGYIEQIKDQQIAADPTGTATCTTALCHGTGLLDVADSGPSCVNCHMKVTDQGGPQIHEWGTLSASTAANIAGHKAYFATVTSYSTCRNSVCHGATLGGVFASGPSCSQLGCHGSGNPLP